MSARVSWRLCAIMELRDFEFLIASAEAGNFGTAAQSLGLDTSTISRRIGRLEDELGLTLFERKRSGVQLTQGGRSVLEHARRVLAEVDSVRRTGMEMGAGRGGHVRLGFHLAPVGCIFAQLLYVWRKRHTNVGVTICEVNAGDLARAFDERRFDIALSPRCIRLADAVRLPLYSERLFAAVPLDHALAERSVVKWNELRSGTVLIPALGDEPTQREFYGAYLGIDAWFEGHAASKHSILALVGTGAGVTLVTESQIKPAIPNVAFKPIDEENAFLEIDLVWRKEMEDPVVGRFVAFLRDESRARNLV